MRSTALPPIAITTVFVAALAFSGPVANAAPRYKKSEIQVKAKKTTVTKAPEKKKTQAPRRPKLHAEQFRVGLRAKVAKLTDAAIRKLKQLINVTENTDPDKPDFLFRLAEHYREKKISQEFTGRSLDEKIYLAKDSARKARLKKTQKAYLAAAKLWMIKAVKGYLTLYRSPQYRKFNRMDEVLFNLAAMLNEIGKKDKAREVFARLIRNYPQSKYIPDAYLSFAEHYFNAGKVEQALSLYERVGRYPDSPIYGYSVYKQGWCWLNLKDERRALELFVKVIKNANKWGGAKRGKIILVKEAKKDAVRAYSHAGTPGRAWNFFRRIGGKYAMKMLERLSLLYYDQGKFLDTIQIYKQLIKLNPKSKKLCDWQYSIVKATLSGKDKKQQVVEVKRLAGVYTVVNKRGGMRKSALSECRSNASGVLRELATTWHREAQKTQNQQTYGLAQYLYKEYLDHFPKERDTYELSFYYAELLFKLEKWDAAALAYTDVVKHNPKGKYLKEAAYAAVISWKNALNVAQEIKDISTSKTKSLKKLPIPEKQKTMIAAFDTYIKYVPKAKELVPIMYRKARIYYESNHFDRASKLFANIAMKHSGHELALYSANLLLDSLNVLKRYADLEKWVDTFLGNPALAQGEFLAQLRKLKTGIQRKRADQLRKQKRFRECGAKYAELANYCQQGNAENCKWEELVYNAAICFEAAKLVGLAISMRSTLIKVKPNHRLAQKALYEVGANYHHLAWYSRAAEHYERYAKKFPGQKEAPDALQNAIVFRLGRGEFSKAQDDAKLFEKNYGRRKASRAAGVNFSLATIYQTRKDSEGLFKHYKKYLKKWGSKGGIDRKILANVRIGETMWRGSCPVKGVDGACVSIKRVRSKRKIRKKRRGKKRKTIELRTQCGPATKSKITVVKRNKAKARAAQKHFKSALALYRRMGKKVKGSSKEDIARRKVDLEFAIGAARFYQAEQQFESFLEVKFPKGLDFSGRNKKKLKKSNKAFGKYLEVKGKFLGKTREVYQDVIKQRTAHWAIAAAARIGQLFQNFADALYTAPVPKPPIPKSLKKRDQKEEFMMIFTDSYCDKLEDQAGKLEVKAVQGLGTCLSKSTELSWYNSWSRLCEKELNQIKPAEYPLASELRSTPHFITVEATRSKVVDQIK